MKIKNKSKLAGLLIVAFTIAFVGCNKKNKNNGKMGGKADTTNAMMYQNNNMGNNQMVNASNSDFVAQMSGKNETHQVQTNASGTVYFKVNSDTSKIMYTIKLSSAKNVTMAHIHYGVQGQNGPIVVWLYPGPNHQSPSSSNKKGMINGVLKSGSFTSANLTGPMQGATIKDLVHAMMHDSTYANVHNKKYPKGFLRGQIKATGNNNSNM